VAEWSFSDIGWMSPSQQAGQSRELGSREIDGEARGRMSGREWSQSPAAHSPALRLGLGWREINR